MSDTLPSYLSLSYDQLADIAYDLAKSIQKDFEPECIIIVARGGLTFAHLLSEHLPCVKLLKLYEVGMETSNLPSSLLVVDDSVGTGNTLKEVVNSLGVLVKTAAIYVDKNSKYSPDYFSFIANTWVRLPWELEVTPGIRTYTSDVSVAANHKQEPKPKTQPSLTPVNETPEKLTVTGMQPTIGVCTQHYRKSDIWVRFTVPGIHYYSDAPLDVAYLRSPHRHLFYFEVKIQVWSLNREIEFHKLLSELKAKYTPTDGQSCFWFGEKSCEQIASDLVSYLMDSKKPTTIEVTVSEDNECGATVTSVPV
jgi:hypoxanthine phosphoribosyltransferase